jgi:hypothetical protein
MSVVGFDFGNDSCIISCCRKGVVDVLQNEIGNRKTRSLAVFTDSMRYLGDQGTSQMMSNYKNSLTMFKRLLGVQADAEEIKSTLGMLPFAVVTMPDGGVGVKVQYKGEKHDFSMEQVCAMMFTKLKQTAENSMQKPVSDCVIRYSIVCEMSVSNIICTNIHAYTNISSLSYTHMHTRVSTVSPPTGARTSAAACSPLPRWLVLKS